MKIERFDWDAGNSFKNEVKHGFTREVIEAFFRGRVFVAPDPKHSTREERFLSIGRGPDQRPRIVAFTIRYRKARD